METSIPKEEPKEPAVSIRKSVTPGYLICSRGRQTFQGAETAFGGARPDAGAVSHEMQASLRLSYGCRQLRGEVGQRWRKRLVLDSWAEAPERANDDGPPKPFKMSSSICETNEYVPKDLFFSTWLVAFAL